MTSLQAEREALVRDVQGKAALLQDVMGSCLRHIPPLVDPECDGCYPIFLAGHAYHSALHKLHLCETRLHLETSIASLRASLPERRPWWRRVTAVRR